MFDAGPAEPLSALATPEAVLEYTPAPLASTRTVMVQLEEAGIVPAVTLNVAPPALAVCAMPGHDPPT